MISLDKIKEAHKKIAPYVNSTPLIHSDFLLYIGDGYPVFPQELVRVPDELVLRDFEDNQSAWSTL